MRILRRLFSALLGLVFSVLCLLTVVTATRAYPSEYTISKSRRIEQHLVETSQYLSAYLAQHGRLPDESELQRWRRMAPENSMRELTWWTGPPFSKEVRAAFGAPAATVANPYVVVFWEGDWDVHYSSWTKTSTLLLDRDQYFLLGSRAADATLFAVLALMSAFLSIGVWPRTASLSNPV